LNRPTNSISHRLTVMDFGNIHIIDHVEDKALGCRREGLDTEVELPYGRYTIEIDIHVHARSKHVVFKRDAMIGAPGKELRWL
jgi:hypothetical protein